MNVYDSDSTLQYLILFLCMVQIRVVPITALWSMYCYFLRQWCLCHILYIPCSLHRVTHVAQEVWCRNCQPPAKTEQIRLFDHSVRADPPRIIRLTSKQPSTASQRNVV